MSGRNPATAYWSCSSRLQNGRSQSRSKSNKLGSRSRVILGDCTMADPQEMTVRDKKELVTKEEKTVPTRHYIPSTDIYETSDALTVVMEVPGVEKKAITVGLENDNLRVEAQIDFSKYEGLEPV